MFSVYLLELKHNTFYIQFWRKLDTIGIYIAHFYEKYVWRGQFVASGNILKAKVILFAKDCHDRSDDKILIWDLNMNLLNLLV